MMNTLLWVSLMLLVGAMAGVAVSPGWATFLLALLMFGFFSAMVVLRLLSGKVREGKAWVARTTERLLDPEAESGPRASDLARLRDPGSRALASDLENLAETPALRRWTRLALGQLVLLQDAGESFDSLLGSKLERGELTYDRYRGALLEARESVMRGITETAARLKGIRPIPGGDPVLVDLREDQAEKINSLLDQNREALTQLIRTGIAVSEMRGTYSQDPGKVRQVVQDLEDLARRARLY